MTLFLSSCVFPECFFDPSDTRSNERSSNSISVTQNPRSHRRGFQIKSSLGGTAIDTDRGMQNHDRLGFFGH
jgi:hypothetical protein